MNIGERVYTDLYGPNGEGPTRNPGIVIGNEDGAVGVQHDNGEELWYDADQVYPLET